MKKIRVLAILLAAVLTLSAVAAVAFAENEEDKDLKVTKKVTWDPNSPNEATVEIVSNVPDVKETQVLFIGTRCGAHGMKSTTLRDSINAIANHADVTYYLLDKDTSSTGYVANVDRGFLKRGGSISSTTIQGSNNHSSLAGFINVLYKELVDEKTVKTKFDYIVLEFDSSRLASGSYQPTDTVLTEVAKKLKTYYENNKVIWITDGRQENTKGGTLYTDSDGYIPTNFYMYGGDGSSSHLTAVQFRNLCALVAPSYYLDTENHTIKKGSYGNGNTTFTLSDYALKTVDRDKSTGSIIKSSYASARQLSYKSAGELEEFVYMVIEGVSLRFTDQIKFSKDISVTGAELYFREAAITSDEAWTKLQSLSITGSTKLQEENSVKYATSGEAFNEATRITANINVTAGNEDTAKNNKVTVDAVNVKGTVKDVEEYLKLVITLTSTNGFADCITLKKNAEGEPILDDNGKLQFIMNPNEGDALVEAFQDGKSIGGENIAEGTGVAAVPTLETRTVTSEVTGGRKAQTGGYVKTEDASANPQSIYSYNGQTVTTTYTPTEGYDLSSITVDSASVTLGTDGKASGTGYTVSRDASTGVVTVTFANLAADHSVAVVFVKQLTVNYLIDGNADASYPEETTNYGAEYTAVTAPTTKAGYTFSGWCTDEECETPYEDGTTLTEDTTLYGKWNYAVTIEKALTSPTDTSNVRGGDDLTYTITVKNGSGTDVTGFTVTDTLDENLSYKSSETTSGKGTVANDSGVVKGTNLTVPANGSITVTITATVSSTLTAAETTITNTVTGKGGESDPEISPEKPVETVVQPKQLTVNYLIDGNADASYPEETTNYGAGYDAKGAPTTKAGYTFSGWCTDEECETPYEDGTTLTEDTTLYGKWNYAVTIEKALTSPTDTSNVRGGDDLTYTITVKNGSGTAVTGFTVTDTLDENLSYKSSATTSTIGTVANDSGVVKGTNLTVPANGSITVTITATVSSTLTAAETTITNTVTGKGGESDPEISPEKPVETVVQPKQLTVNYLIDGNADASCPEQTTNYGYEYTAVTAPTKAGYTFSGWYKDAEYKNLYSKTALTEDTTLYGKWTPVSNYTVTKDVTYDKQSIAGGTCYSNRTVTYSISVTNNHTVETMTAELVDQLPAGLTIVESSVTDGGGVYKPTEGTITWSIQSIAPRTTKTVTFNATVPAELATVTNYENKAYVAKSNDVDYDGSGDKDDPATVSFKGVPVKVLTLTKTWSDTWDSHTGETVKIQIYRNGTKLGDPVELTKDAKTLYVDAVDGNGAAYEYTFKEVKSATEEVEKTGLNGLYCFDYSIDNDTAASTTAPASAEINLTNTYQIQPSDLEFNKTAVGQAEAGGTFTYTLTVKNTRAYETAENIVVEDILPAGLTVTANDAVTPDTLVQDTQNLQKYTWTIASLAQGATATLNLTVAVPAGVTAQEYTNIASIVSIGGTTYNTPKTSPEAKTTVRSFTVSKVWKDSKGNPVADTTGMNAVTVSLMQNGVKYESVKLKNDNNWTYTWTKLPLKDTQGVPYTYTVIEDAVEGYTAVADYYGSSGTYGDAGAEISNTLDTVHVTYQFVGEDQPEGVTLPDGDVKDYGTEYTSAAKPSTQEAPASYYAFAGWYTDAACTKLFEDGTELKDDLTLYGKWTRKTVTVVVVAPEEGPDTKYPEPWNVNEGEKANPPTQSDPNSEYIFEGYYWDPDIKLIADPDELFTNPVLDESNVKNGQLKLYPKWTKKVRVTYAFSGKVPEGVDPPTDELLAPGSMYTAKTASGSLQQYSFDGWYTDAACKVKYVNGSELTGDIVLYGKWVEVAVPKTADDNSLDTWMSWAFLAAMGMAGAVTFARKKRNH